MVEGSLFNEPRLGLSPQFEGIPVYPHMGRFWEIIEKYKVSKFYTAPTAIRLLMKHGREPVQK